MVAEREPFVAVHHESVWNIYVHDGLEPGLRLILHPRAFCDNLKVASFVHNTSADWIEKRSLVTVRAGRKAQVHKKLCTSTSQYQLESKRV